jgi:hypothetical protein
LVRATCTRRGFLPHAQQHKAALRGAGRRAAIPVAIVTGYLMSGYVLQLDRLFGLQGWQWLLLMAVAWGCAA